MKFISLHIITFEIQRLRNRHNSLNSILEAEKASTEPRPQYMTKLSRTIQDIEMLISDLEDLSEYETKSP